MKRTILSLLVAGTLTTSAFAGTMDSSNKWEEGAKDAWIDGKAEATLLFNGNLNSFDINTDVQNGKVVLTGKVENSVDKKLAEELVANIDGVTDVDNQLTILADHDDADVDNNDMDGEAAMDKLTDAKIATVIKTRLLMDTDISGFDIDVDVKAGNVTLTGTVDSDAERDLAVEIAKNASDVTDVEDNLKVVEPQKAMASE
ncbi:BON domain-containing protein [Alteromonas confluentis]|uniref:Transporter n=1 Tax=Alteromonas confluentis TaxID=1656094 RepID=A0A1E7ZBS5_9ALTE|nr:BON domain-containing protein [Alteromonas confluentis]OFC70911.1 transporter [Alteromonas confluentis]